MSKKELDLWAVQNYLRDALVELADEERVSKLCGGLSINYIKGIRKQAFSLLNKLGTLDNAQEIQKKVAEDKNESE